MRRAEGRCEYCHTPQKYCPDPFSVEHIRPKSLGGGTDETNLALSCQGCNGHKHVAFEAADPITGGTVPLFNPRKDQWDIHFGWIENDSVLVGKTSVGRATIERLKLNREYVVNLRRVLSEYNSQRESIGE